MLKITAGAFKGRSLTWKPAPNVRPTPAKVREAVFNILGDVATTVWADLCSGTGIIGFEALSRGAQQVFFVERHRPTLARIRKNAQALQTESASVCVALPVSAFLAQFQLPAFDVLYGDPPYDSGVYEDILSSLHAHPERLRSATGVLILEHRKQRALPEQWQSLERIQQRCYGDTVLSFYRQVQP